MARARRGARRRANPRRADAAAALGGPHDGGGRAGARAGAPGADTREKLRRLLRGGDLDERILEIEFEDAGATPTVSLFTPQGVEEMGMQFKDLLGSLLPRRTRRRRLSVKAAREAIVAEEAVRLVDMDHVRELAIQRVEQTGIVFIDELDKVASSAQAARSGPDVSREGVAGSAGSSRARRCRKLASAPPITSVHRGGRLPCAKPSDLIPELQGRFPIRVELSSLSEADFVRILAEPRNSLVLQYTELLRTEGVELEFKEDGVRTIAEYAAKVNQRSDDIGARRLYTVMEKLLEHLSFDAPDLTGARQVSTRPSCASGWIVCAGRGSLALTCSLGAREGGEHG